MLIRYLPGSGYRMAGPDKGEIIISTSPGPFPRPLLSPSLSFFPSLSPTFSPALSLDDRTSEVTPLAHSLIVKYHREEEKAEKDHHTHGRHQNRHQEV